jgi:hypothetical protein
VVESVGANPISIDGGSNNTVYGPLSEIGKKNRELIAAQSSNLLISSITPRSKNNSEIAQTISTMEEGAPQVITFPIKVEVVEMLVEVVELHPQTMIQIDYHR